MKSGIRQSLAGAALTTLAAALPAAAQDESTNRVSVETAWSVFVEDDPKECWGVSAPTETVNTRNGEVVSVTRGDILLFVTFRPGESGEVTFTGGYPFADDSTVSVDIGGREFEMFTENVRDSEGDMIGWAWPASSSGDSELISAMRAGADATMTARSSRGTTTADTFSLYGFSAAMEDAEQRCSE
ncbi:invasion associated locus B family protein [Tranquillimonas rosea]|nr:invasion associated locus B family protein [Tranquillimonas rosea]